jgi:hypothetical protein
MKVKIQLANGKVVEHYFVPNKKSSGMKKFRSLYRNIDPNAKPIVFI